MSNRIVRPTRRAISVVVAALVVAVSGAGVGAAAAPSAGGHLRHKPAAAAAVSGVYEGSITDASAASFAAWRRRPVDLLHTFSAGSWAVIEHPYGLANAGRLFLSIGLLPRNDATATLAGCAAGAYDRHFRAGAASVVAAGHGDSFVRLGWEFNRAGARWTIDPVAANGNTDQTANYAACFRRAVTAMRSPAGQAFRFVWSPASGTTQVLPDPALAYPGDRYVDVVGPDQYDHWYNHPGAAFADRWRALLTGGGRGLTFWSGFAQAHGKSYGYSEWGTWDTASTTGGVSQGGGGDDPQYIAAVADQLAALRGSGTPTVELYFNATAGDGDHYLGPGSTRFPNAAAEYIARFGGLTPRSTP